MSLFFNRRIEHENGKIFEVNTSKNRGWYFLINLFGMAIFIIFSSQNILALIGWGIVATMVLTAAIESKFYYMGLPFRKKEFRMKGSPFSISSPQEFWIEK